MISSPIFLFNLPVHVSSHHAILILYYYVSVYIFKLILVCFQLTLDNYADIYHHVARRTGSTALSIVHYKQPCRRKGLCCHLCRADSSKCLADQCSQHAPYVSGWSPSGSLTAKPTFDERVHHQRQLQMGPVFSAPRLFPRSQYSSWSPSWSLTAALTWWPLC